MRKILSSLFFLVLGFSVSVFSQSLSALPDLRFYQTPEDKHTPILQLIDQSKKSVDVMIFNLTDMEIIKSLINAQKRGVQVRVIVDQNAAHRVALQNNIKRLQAGGVSVYLSSPGFSITHMKSMVVDSEVAFISTMNFIRNHHLMRDYGVTTTDKAIVAEMNLVFEADVKNSVDQTAVTPNVQVQHLVWSPVNSLAKIVGLLNSAKVSIDLVVENLSDSRVIQALSEAAARGIPVRVLMSTCVYGGNPFFNFPYLQKLKAAGVDVQINGVLYQHAKAILIDGRTFFVGSENFSFNSLRKARELGVVFQNDQVNEAFLRTFESDWAQSEDLPAEQPKSCPFTFNSEFISELLQWQ